MGTDRIEEGKVIMRKKPTGQEIAPGVYLTGVTRKYVPPPLGERQWPHFVLGIILSLIVLAYGIAASWIVAAIIKG